MLSIWRRARAAGRDCWSACPREPWAKWPIVGTARVLRRDAAQIRTSGIPWLRLIAVGEGTRRRRHPAVQRASQRRGAGALARGGAGRQSFAPSRKTLRLDVRFNTATLGIARARSAPKASRPSSLPCGRRARRARSRAGSQRRAGRRQSRPPRVAGLPAAAARSVIRTAPRAGGLWWPRSRMSSRVCGVPPNTRRRGRGTGGARVRPFFAAGTRRGLGGFHRAARRKLADPGGARSRERSHHALGHAASAGGGLNDADFLLARARGLRAQRPAT